MPHTRPTLILGCAALLLLAGCGPTVVNSSLPVQSAAGKSTGTLQLTLTENTPIMGPSTITAQAVASDGEIFNGKVTLENESTNANSFAFDVNFGNRKDKRGWGMMPGWQGSETTRSTARAVLIGTKGHSMTCTLNLASAQDGISAGGVGTCQISDGRTVPVTF